jgi:uncharacterized protein YdaU (DUF1376 family)
MADFPYFPLYPTDLLGDDKVLVMDLTEFGAYMRLLCIAWQQDPAGSIPSDPKIISRLLGITTEQWSSIATALLPCWQEMDGRLYNKRMVSIYQDMIEKRHKRQMAGQLGGTKKSKQCSSNALAMLKHTGSGSGSGNGSWIGNGETSDTGLTYPFPPPRDRGDDAVVPDAPPPLPDDVKKWMRMAFSAFPDAGKPTGPERQKVVANVIELISAGKDFKTFDLICEWVERAPYSIAKFKPKDAAQLTNPANWTMWLSHMRETDSRIEEEERKKRR